MILITIFVPVTPGFKSFFPFLFITFKIFLYFGHVQFMARFVYKQIISDKKFGATYLTVLGSTQNFFRMFTMNISYALIGVIGLKSVVLSYIAINGYMIFGRRENYLQWLESKSEDDFKVGFSEKDTKKQKTQ